jgi:hypothetical protein
MRIGSLQELVQIVYLGSLLNLVYHRGIPPPAVVYLPAVAFACLGGGPSPINSDNQPGCFGEEIHVVALQRPAPREPGKSAHFGTGEDMLVTVLFARQDPDKAQIGLEACDCWEGFSVWYNV